MTGQLISISVHNYGYPTGVRLDFDGEAPSTKMLKPVLIDLAQPDPNLPGKKVRRPHGVVTDGRLFHDGGHADRDLLINRIRYRDKTSGGAVTARLNSHVEEALLITSTLPKEDALIRRIVDGVKQDIPIRMPGGGSTEPADAPYDNTQNTAFFQKEDAAIIVEKLRILGIELPEKITELLENAIESARQIRRGVDIPLTGKAYSMTAI